MKRATEDHVVKAKEGSTFSKAPSSRTFLNVAGIRQIAAKLARAPRNPRCRSVAERDLEIRTRLRGQKIALEKAA